MLQLEIGFPTSSRPPGILAARELPGMWHSHSPNEPGPPERYVATYGYYVTVSAGFDGEGL